MSPKPTPSSNQSISFDLNLEKLTGGSEDQIDSFQTLLRSLAPSGILGLAGKLREFLDQSKGNSQPIPDRLETTLNSLLEASGKKPSTLVAAIKENCLIAPAETQVAVDFFKASFGERLRDIDSVQRCPIVNLEFYPSKVVGLKIDMILTPDESELRADPVSKRAMKRLTANPIDDRGLWVVILGEGVRDVCTNILTAQRDYPSQVFELIETDVQCVVKRLKPKEINVFRAALSIETLRESLGTLLLDEGIDRDLREFFGKMEDKLTQFLTVAACQFDAKTPQNSRFHFFDDFLASLTDLDDEIAYDKRRLLEYQYIRIPKGTAWPQLVAKSYEHVDKFFE
jgi:hypothetical protein